MPKIDLGSGQLDSEQRITLGLLTAVHDNERVSQRSISSELSIALGLTNTYLKRCIKKGLIKVTQAPANRYAYYLTPQGFSEKTRLTAEFLSQSLNLFRVSREEAGSLFRKCQLNGWQKVVLLGNGDLVEIFAMSAPTESIILAHFSGNLQPGDIDYGLHHLSDPADLKAFDAAIICDMTDPFRFQQIAAEALQSACILAPGFLGLHKKPRPANDVVE